jgi:small GTP-binding protein
VLNELPPGLTSTVGVEFTKRVVTEKQTGQRIQLHIWDTAGQEKFKSVTKHYYRGTDICLLTFDLSYEDSFNEVHHWVSEIREYTPEGCVVVLIGNKADLANRTVDRDKALHFANQNGFFYHETSALWPRQTSLLKDGIAGGIEVIFDKIINQIFKSHTTKEEPHILKKEPLKVDLGYVHRRSDCEC